MKQRLNPQIARIGGITLIELMIVVVIIAIIASIAYPSYIRQIQKAGRTDATSALLSIAAAQEKEFLKNNAYTGDLPTLGITATESNKYTLSVEVTDDGDGFIATAVPGTLNDKSQVSDTKCAEFTIDHTGAKRSQGESADGLAGSDGCW